jgi:hypothetical protein
MTRVQNSFSGRRNQANQHSPTCHEICRLAMLRSSGSRHYLFGSIRRCCSLEQNTLNILDIPHLCPKIISLSSSFSERLCTTDIFRQSDESRLTSRHTITRPVLWTCFVLSAIPVTSCEQLTSTIVKKNLRNTEIFLLWILLGQTSLIIISSIILLETWSNLSYDIATENLLLRQTKSNFPS